MAFIKTKEKQKLKAIEPQKMKPRKKPAIRISKGTLIFIGLILIIFAVLNFYIVPKLVNIPKVENPVIVYEKPKHVNLELLENQLKIREKPLPNLILPPPEIGKEDPFR